MKDKLREAEAALAAMAELLPFIPAGIMDDEKRTLRTTLDGLRDELDARMIEDD